MFETELIHPPQIEDKFQSLNPAIYPSAVFLFKNMEELIDFVSSKNKNRFEYSRYGNPTNRNLELLIAHLEKTEDAYVVSSGMSACTLPILTFLQSGDHIIFSSDMYLKTRNFIEKTIKKFNIQSTVVFPKKEEILNAIQPNTKMVFIEFPTNPFYYVIDLKPLSEELKKHNILLVVDSTLSSPYNCNPIEFGADLVVHSLTKYFSGQNDLIAGAIAGSKNYIEKIREFNGELGAILPAEISYKIYRSSKTLAIRMQYHNETTLEIADYLYNHPKIKKVYYPMHPSHPDYSIAKKYLKGGGCLLTIELDGNFEALKTFCNSCNIFRIGPSFASAESLLDPPIVMSHWDVPEVERKKMNIFENTLRISVGLENKNDLIKDLEQALNKI
ncbi:MAG: cystathionine gamma-synthase [Leptospiraceae bacterium]|nr:MAG: cystathionine gamma-synthase [Leptospiraceae bacterium]